MSNIKVCAIDTRVGRRVRLGRVMRGVTQCELGTHIGVTLQQIQKYERSENRISAGRLFMIANVLKLPLDFFYKNLESFDDSERGGDELHEDDGSYVEFDSLYNNDSIMLVKAYAGIQNPEVRRRLLDLAKALTCSLRFKKA